MSAAFDTVVSRLEQVRRRSPDQVSARCPAHDDKVPSLSVRGLPDGRVLMKCFAGCTVHEVVSAIGLDVADLFPPRDDTSASVSNGAGPERRRRLLSAGQALALLSDESCLVAVAASNVAHGVTLTDDDRARVLQAAGRIAYLQQEATA